MSPIKAVRKGIDIGSLFRFRSAEDVLKMNDPAISTQELSYRMMFMHTSP